jgi:energy-coupling factor transporter ATP-binding protein EcfA2
VRITNLKLKAFRGFSTEFDLPFDSSGKSLLVYGENGSAKSSLARALELLFDPNPARTLAEHQNLFTAAAPEIKIIFTGRKAGALHAETLTWSSNTSKPLPSWLLSSIARSAFLDHRKFLLLSDHRSRDLSKAFFETAVHDLFGNLPAGSSGETVAGLQERIRRDASRYRDALDAPKKQAAATGLAAPVSRSTPIEGAVNDLNSVLNAYLSPGVNQTSDLVAEAGRFLSHFENLRLTVSLSFDPLTFSRKDGELGGGRLHPRVTYCTKALGTTDGSEWSPSHHLVLNEARLTALSLALFFAAVRLQDRIAYIPGAADPEEPARLLVLDDILVGLDYEHRIPVMEIIRNEFAKDRRYQIVLMTHDRVWFDIARLQIDESEWKIVEMYAKKGEGPDHSDLPMRKQSSADLIQRAQQFLVEHELPAAANYARTALESALRRICEAAAVPIAFKSDPQRMQAEVFINALQDIKRRRGSSCHLIPLSTQKTLKALRSTVLNPLSHANATTVTAHEVSQAIDIAEKLERISRKVKP